MVTAAIPLVLCRYPAAPDLQRTEDPVGAGVSAEHQDLRVRAGVEQISDHLQAVGPREVAIEEADVRLPLAAPPPVSPRWCMTR